ncbi:MAG: hypothetical protein J0L88_04320 [Xanthomonadales bacterium]|nr:hypothetical protein [Xanthomonadales bacterium]
MAVSFRCRCGGLRGEVDIERAYARATCYCTDCRAFARVLGAEAVLDAAGGTDIVPIVPAALHIRSGLGHLACLSLTEAGLLRWYADCCRMPLANTPRSASVAYAGVLSDALDVAPGALEARLGARGRTVINAKSATSPVKSTPLTLAIGGLRIALGVTRARLRGERDSVFFDAQGQPVREPRVLSKDERAALD